MVLRDGVRHLLEEDRLADARRRDDETALAEADRREEIDHAHRRLARRRLEDDAARGKGRHEVLEVDDTRGLARRLAVHRHDVAEREEAVLVARIADRPHHGVARAERMAADLLLGNEHVFRAGEEVRLRAAEETVALLHDLEAARGHHGPAAVEVTADRAEDDLVALHRAKVFRVRVRPHLRDDVRIVPGMDVLKVVLRQVGIARYRGGGRRKVLRNLEGRTPVALRRHLNMLAAVLEVRTVPVALCGACQPFHPPTLPIAHRLFARRRNRGLRRDRLLLIFGRRFRRRFLLLCACWLLSGLRLGRRLRCCFLLLCACSLRSRSRLRLGRGCLRLGGRTGGQLGLGRTTTLLLRRGGLCGDGPF